MKLDAETVRDVLLCLEDRIIVNDAGEATEVTANDIVTYYNGKYSKGEVLYTLERLDEAGYVVFSALDASGRIVNASIIAISYYGHEFLDTVRDVSVWQKTKQVIPAACMGVLSIIKDVATEIIKNAVVKKLDL